MSNLKKITNQNLDENLKALVVSEREILSEIILHIVEAERRKLYLTFGFPSLFEYLTKSVGYASGSAQRRIDAARLSLMFPMLFTNLNRAKLISLKFRQFKNQYEISKLQKIRRFMPR